MTFPKKFNRQKEPLRDFVDLVCDIKNYTEENGKLRPLKITISNQSAKYVRERCYYLFRKIREEFKLSRLPAPPQPRITKQGQTLTFTWKEGRSSIQWEVVE